MRRANPVTLAITANSPVQRAQTWPQRLAYTAAALFTLSSGGTNLIYGLTQGTDLAVAGLGRGLSRRFDYLCTVVSKPHRSDAAA